MSFERRICVQTQDLQIFKKFYKSQMNPKEAFQNTYIQSLLVKTKTRHSLKRFKDI